MSAGSDLRVASGYDRALLFGGNWTMIISPYRILYFILVILVGSANGAGSIAATLEFAGDSPLAFQATAFLDGLFHALFFVTVIAVYIAIRAAFPVRASLLLVCGAWQMLMGISSSIWSMVWKSLRMPNLLSYPIPGTRCL